MECKHCKSKWDTDVITKNCPFCGHVIIDNVECLDIAGALKRIITENSLGIFEKPKIVISLVADYVKGYEKEKKLLRIAASNDALKYAIQISNESDRAQQQLLVQKLNKILIDDAFLSEENAAIILNILLDAIKDNYCIISDKNPSTTHASFEIQPKEVEESHHVSSAPIWNFDDMPRYIETIRRASEGSSKVKTIDEYAAVGLRIEPYNDGKFFFDCEISDDNLPDLYLKIIKNKLIDCLSSGLISGCPVEGVKVILTSLLEHPVFSTRDSFEKVTKEAFETAYEKAAPVIKEQFIAVKVYLSDSGSINAISSFMNKINELRGRVMDADLNTISFEVPIGGLDSILEYIEKSNAIKLMNKQFVRYEEVTASAAQEIIRELKTKL